MTGRRSRSGSSSRRRSRNPVATAAQYRKVLAIATGLSNELDPTGRAAVLLAGSWARGDAHEASDIDLWVVGKRGPNRFLERDGYMVCVKFSTVAEERREMRNPGRLDGAIPGWRNAKVLRDPRRLARDLKARARRFRWEPLLRARDKYVSDQLAGWAEEVAKLLRALETGERETAAVQRNLLANHMAFLELLKREHLWETENGMWEIAARRAGREFASTQRAALATDRADWRESCEAALRLYAMTARSNRATLTGDHRRIVEGVCRRAGYPIDRRRGPGR